MRIWKQLLLASVLALAITSLLALLPPSPAARQDAPVFRLGDSSRLGLDNLVDVMSGQRWHSKLDRVIWSQGELTVDFIVSMDADAKQLSSDLLALLQLSFVSKNNIERLLVRFLEQDEPVKQGSWSTESLALLLAADVRSSDGELVRYLDGLVTGDIMQSQWRDHFRIIVTPRWHQRYGPLPE